MLCFKEYLGIRSSQCIYIIIIIRSSSYINNNNNNNINFYNFPTEITRLFTQIA